MSTLKMSITLSLLLLAGANAFANDCNLEIAELARQEQRTATECATFDEENPEEGKLRAACLMNLEAMVSFREQKAATCVAAPAVDAKAKAVDMTGLRARLWNEFLTYVGTLR